MNNIPSAELTDLGRPCRCCPQERECPAWFNNNLRWRMFFSEISIKYDQDVRQYCPWFYRLSSQWLLTWSGYQTMIWSLVSPGAWINSRVMPARVIVNRSENTFSKLLSILTNNVISIFKPRHILMVDLGGIDIGGSGGAIKAQIQSNASVLLRLLWDFCSKLMEIF